jgi:hypothetical protein
MSDEIQIIAEQTKNFGVVGFRCESEQEAKVSARTMRLVLDWIKEQGMDIYVRRPITVSAHKDYEHDVDMFQVTFRAALLPSEGMEGREIMTRDLHPQIGLGK